MGGEPADNAAITRAILSGADHGPRRDIVVLNAAAALASMTAICDGPSGPRRDRQRGALATLDAWIAKTKQLQDQGLIMSVSNLTKRRGTMLDEIMRFHRAQLPKIKRQIPLEDVRALPKSCPRRWISPRR